MNRHKTALDFEGASIGGSGYFHQGFDVQGKVRLWGATIGGAVSFANAVFHGDEENGLDARYSTITGPFTWKNVSITPKTKLLLSHAKIGLLDDSESSWPEAGHLSLDGFVYEGIKGPPPETKQRKQWLSARLRWLQSQSDDEFSLQPYEQLASILRRAGLEADAKKVLYIKQEVLRMRSRSSIIWYCRWLIWIRDRILRVSIGYGFYSFRVLGWAGLFWFIGERIFQYGYTQGLITPTAEETPPSFHSVMYSLDTLLPIIDFHQEAAWVPQAGTWILWYFWFHIFIGWVLSTLAVGGFTGLIRRD